jgi:hypothetical protein
VPAVIEFYDIAGLVRGASEGEGLGNQFLGHIKQVSAIVQVVRVFANKDVTHVEDNVDPTRDIDIINTELILKDIETVNNRIDSVSKKAKSDKKLQPVLDHLKELAAVLDDGKMASNFSYEGDEEEVMQSRKELQLLTDKPMMYLVNVEPERSEEGIAIVKEHTGTDNVIAMDVKLESELLEMEEKDKREFMESYGLEETGLERLSQRGYQLLDLISFFTAGEKEAKAWTIERGSSAPEAAAAIHTDFQKNFIAAEVVNSKDYIELGGWEAAKAAGKLKLEGKDYIVKDGDVVIFKIGAT